jgi:hypothetical protein
MKWFLVLVFIPASSFCQTVHIKDGRIFYEGIIKSNSKPVLEAALQEAEKRASTCINNLSVYQDSSTGLVATSLMKLNPLPGTANTLRYTLSLSAQGAGLTYTIDSVSLITKQKGRAKKIISSKELIDGMDVTGPAATQTEKKLNEIDMRILQLIDLLTHYLTK